MWDVNVGSKQFTIYSQVTSGEDSKTTRQILANFSLGKVQIAYSFTRCSMTQSLSRYTDVRKNAITSLPGILSFRSNSVVERQPVLIQAKVQIYRAILKSLLGFANR